MKLPYSPSQNNDPEFLELDTVTVSTEMLRFSEEAPKHFKKVNVTLERDIVAVLRETKITLEGKVLTKYKNINIIEGKKKAVIDTKEALDKFITVFKGTFNTFSKFETVPSFDPKL